MARCSEITPARLVGNVSDIKIELGQPHAIANNPAVLLHSYILPQLSMPFNVVTTETAEQFDKNFLWLVLTSS